MRATERREGTRLLPARLLLGGLAAVLVLMPEFTGARELTLYSARKEDLIRPAIEAFQKETGHAGA